MGVQFGTFWKSICIRDQHFLFDMASTYQNVTILYAGVNKPLYTCMGVHFGTFWKSICIRDQIFLFDMASTYQNVS